MSGRTAGAASPFKQPKAVFAVFGASRLQASLGIARTMYLNLSLFAIVVLAIAIWTTDRAALAAALPAIDALISQRDASSSGASSSGLLAPASQPS